MSNPFDQFDSVEASSTSTKNPFDQFDESPTGAIEKLSRVDGIKNAPEWASNPSPTHRENPDDMSWVDTQVNRGKAILDSFGNMLGGVIKSDAAIAATRPAMATGARFMPAGGQAFVYPEEMRMADKERAMTPEQIADDRAKTYQSMVKVGDQAADDSNFGYKDLVGAKYELGKQKISNGNWLSGAVDIVSAGLDGVANSAAMWVPGTQPAAISQYSGEIIQNRVNNTKGKGAPSAEDLGIGLAAGTAMTALEMWLPARLVKAGKPVAQEEAKQISESVVKHVAKQVLKEAGKDAGVEGLTEALQNGLVQYVSERWGTDAAIDFNEMAKQAVDGFVLGAAGGGVLGGAKGVHSGFSEAGQAKKLMQSELNADTGIDQPTNGESIGGGIVDDIQNDQHQTGPVNPETVAAQNSPGMRDLGPLTVDETQAGGAHAAPGAFEGVAQYADQQRAQQEAQRRAAETAWLNEDTSLADAARAYGERQGFISKTPEQVESELSKPVDVEAELAGLMADLDSAEKLARQRPAVNSKNPFDQFDESQSLPDVQQPEPMKQQGEGAANTQSINDDEQSSIAPAAESLDGQYQYQRPIPLQSSGMRSASETDQAESKQQDQPQESYSLAATEPTEQQSASEKIDMASAEAATSPENNLPEPTLAQKEAGNYRKAHVNIKGLNISIENPRGSTRSGTAPDGKPWSVTMHNHYGYIKRTEGADGEHVDTFIGPNPESDKVFIVDQVNPDGGFDEHKVMIGFDSKMKARSGYKSNYSSGWKVGPITSMTMPEFKEWLKNGDTKKPLAQQLNQAPVKNTGPEKSGSHLTQNKPDQAIKEPQPSAGVSVSDTAKMSADYIKSELSKLTNMAEQRAKEEFDKNNGFRPPVPKSSWEYLTPAERSRMHELKQALPSFREEREAAIARNKERIANRKRIKQDELSGSNLEKLPKILTAKKSSIIAKMAKERKIKNDSPGYADAMKKVEADYEKELDRAQAALPFDEFNKLNSDSPEGVNRQAWEALRKEYGTDDIRYSLAQDQTETTAFKSWFGDSKVVDADGKPRVMYHGTASSFDEFSKKKANDKEGRKLGFDWGKDKFYFAETGEAASSSAEFAQMTGRGKQMNVMPVYLSVNKPISSESYMDMIASELDSGLSRDAAIAKVDKKIRSQGYDGIVDEGSGGIAVFEPNQIKSATGNNGEFNPENPDIRYSLGNSGGIPTKEVQSVIDGIRKAWKNQHIKIEAVDNVDGMPDPVKDRIKSDKVPNEKVKAVFHEGNVYINASAMRDAADVERAIFHEVYGHYGVHVLFGRDTSVALGRLYIAIGGEKGMRDMAKRHGIDLGKYEQILKSATPAKRAEVMMDELLAHIAQDSRPSVKRWLKELIGTIRTWLRAHGFNNLGSFNDNEILALLKRARDAATDLKLDGGSVSRVLLDERGTDSNYADQQAPAYSLDGLPPKTRKVIGSDPLLSAWTLLSQHDGAFQLPVSDKKGLTDIFSELEGDRGYTIERDDTIAKTSNYKAQKGWLIRIPVSEAQQQRMRDEGEYPTKYRRATVLQNGKSVWIDISDGIPGADGKRVYNAVANYAYNNGLVFIGDPAGLSDQALTRRLENMISSALKFGTTKHLWPHERQVLGDKIVGVPGLTWKDGDDAGNLKNMIKASYEATKNQFPEIEDLRYNPETDRFEDSVDGSEYTADNFRELAEGKRSKSGSESLQQRSGESGKVRGTITAGRTSLERAVLTHSILRGTREEQSRILEKLSHERPERLTGDDNAILYSLSSDEEARPKAGFSVSGLKENPIVFGIGIDSLLRIWQDKMRPLLRTQNAIKQSGGTIGEKEDAYLAEEAFHGKTENDLRKMRERYLEPMAKKMADYGIEREELDMYLWAKHAQERNTQIAKINPEMPDGGSGMTNAQALEILDQAKREGKQSRLDDLAGIVYQLLDEKRKIMRHSLADDAMVDTWNNTYKYYVPLKGRAVDDSGGSYPRVGRGFDIRGKESLRALGRRTKPESPTLHAIKDTTEAIIRYRKNEVGNALLSLVQANPNPEYWEAYDSSNPDFERRLLKKSGKEVVGPAKVINKEDYFITKRDGKEYYIRIEDPLLMRAMKNMGPEKMNWVVRQLAKASRFLSAMVTSYNPEFVVTNFSRDIQTAILNLQAEIDLHNGKAKGKQITANMIKGVPSAARAVYASLNGKTLTGDAAKWQQSFDDFRNDGANTGWFQLLDIEQQASALKDLMELNKKSPKGRFLKTRKVIGDFVSNLNSAVENAIRLSVYKSAVDSGISRKQAASLAKNLTVNFNRKGDVGASVNALYMFFNASVQGTAAFARAMGTLKIDDNGKRKLNVAQKAAVGIMLASYGLAILNRSAAGEDDDGENWWDKVPDYVKERNLVIMKSTWGGPEGEYITIPLPYGYNVFNALANNADSAVNGKKGIGESAGALIKALMGAFSPIGVAESKTAAGATIRTLTPTAFKPIADLASNENFFGTQVFKENFEFGAKKPESYLHLRSTNDFWVWASEFMNDATGGSPYRSGLIDVSPDKLGYIFNYFVGGAGQFYSRVINLGIKGAEDREIESKDVPFVRRFEGKVSWYPDQQKFYDRKEKIDQVVAEYKALPGGSKEKSDFKGKYSSILEMNFMAAATAKRLAKLRKHRDEIENDESLSEKQKEEKLKPLELMMKASIDRFNGAYTKKNQG